MRCYMYDKRLTIYVIEGKKDGVWKTVSYHWTRSSADVYLKYVKNIWHELDYFRLVEFKRAEIIEEGTYEKKKDV